MTEKELLERLKKFEEGDLSVEEMEQMESELRKVDSNHPKLVKWRSYFMGLSQVEVPEAPENFLVDLKRKIENEKPSGKSIWIAILTGRGLPVQSVGAVLTLILIVGIYFTQYTPNTYPDDEQVREMSFKKGEEKGKGTDKESEDSDEELEFGEEERLSLDEKQLPAENNGMGWGLEKRNRRLENEQQTNKIEPNIPPKKLNESLNKFGKADEISGSGLAGKESELQGLLGTSSGAGGSSTRGMGGAGKGSSINKKDVAKKSTQSAQVKKPVPPPKKVNKTPSNREIPMAPKRIQMKSTAKKESKKSSPNKKKKLFMDYIEAPSQERSDDLSLEEKSVTTSKTKSASKSVDKITAEKKSAPTKKTPAPALQKSSPIPVPQSAAEGAAVPPNETVEKSPPTLFKKFSRNEKKGKSEFLKLSNLKGVQAVFIAGNKFKISANPKHMKSVIQELNKLGKWPEKAPIFDDLAPVVVLILELSPSF